MGKIHTEHTKKLLAAVFAVIMCVMVFAPMTQAGNFTGSKGATSSGLTPASDNSWLLTPLVPSQKTSITPNDPPAFDQSVALTAGANYLKHSQADITEDNAGNGNPDIDPNDGGWDWLLPLGTYTHTASPSPQNIYGETTLGLYYGYLITNDPSYMVAMTDVANKMKNDINFRSASDCIFLMLYSNLPGVTSSTYQDQAKAKYDYQIANHGGSATSFALYVRWLRGSSQGYHNGIVAWDTGAWAHVAAMLSQYYSGYSADAAAIAEVLYQDSFVNTSGYFDFDSPSTQGWDPSYSNSNYWWYTLGISGLIEAFTYSNTHMDTMTQLLSVLINCRYSGSGAFSYCYGANTNDEDWQSTAYAVINLGHYNPAAYQAIINQACTWTVSTQHTSGGWMYSDNTHYPEVASENTYSLYYANGVIENTRTHVTYSTIQAAIDDALADDTISVGQGIYHENQIVINKPITVQGAGWTCTKIDGGDAILPSDGLIRIIASGNVVFTGFTVQNAGGPTNGDDGADDLTNVGIFVQSASPSATYTISDNKIIGLNNPDDSEEYGLYADCGQESLVFQHNVITHVASNSVLIERNPGATDISYNTLDAGCWGIDPIYYMTYSGTDITTLQKIRGNTIDVGTGINPHGTSDNKVTGLGFSSAYLGCTGSSTDTGKYSNIEISDNIINNVKDFCRGIALDNFAWGNGAGGEISYAVIKGNIINGVGATIPGKSFGIRLSGLVTNTQILENQIYNGDMSFYGCTGFYGASTAYPVNTQIHYNVFSGNLEGLVWMGTDLLDARYNYWGDPAGPGFGTQDHFSGNVVASPFIDTANPYWQVTLNFKKEGTSYNWDYAIFGEKTDAKDGQDMYDVPKPTNPPAPYIAAWFNAGLTTPYDRLWSDFHKFLHCDQVYDLYVQADTGASPTSVVITWDHDAVKTSEYTHVDLLSSTDVLLADMTSLDTYTVSVPQSGVVHFKIRCHVNLAPVANNDPAVTPEDTPVWIPVLSNDHDLDVNPVGHLDPASVTITTPPSHGTITGINTVTGDVQYSSVLDYNGADSFCYKVKDNDGEWSNIATVSITITAVNDPPVAAADNYPSAVEDTTLIVDTASGVLSNDHDVDDSITAIKFSDPAHGILTLNSDGSFTYAPSLNWHGVDSFTYKAYDGELYSALTTVIITVAAVNDIPIADPQSLTVTQEYTLDITLTGNDNADSIDGTSITAYTIQSLPGQGTLLDGSTPITTVPHDMTGSLHYVANGASGTTSFKFTVTDNGWPLPAQTSAQATITINVIGLHSTNLKAGWNLVTNPCDAAISKSNLIVNYDGSNHNWATAVGATKVMDTIYGWDRIGQVYTYGVNTLQPGEAYWVWAYTDCQLRFPSNAGWSGQITALKTQWNMMGIPYDGTPINPSTLHVNYGGLVTWDYAVSHNYILGFIYGWDRTTQQYTLPTQFNSGEGYWMYAYVNCNLQQ